MDGSAISFGAADNARVRREVMRLVELGRLHVCPWCPPGYFHAHRLLKVGGERLCITHAAKAREMLDRPLWRFVRRCYWTKGTCLIFTNGEQDKHISVDAFWGRNV